MKFNSNTHAGFKRCTNFIETAIKPCSGTLVILCLHLILQQDFIADPYVYFPI